MITTVSSTPCWKGGRTDRPGLVRLAALLFLAWMLAWMPGRASAQSHEASVDHLRLDLGDDGVYLTAQVDFDLPPVVEDVLDKGIAVYFVAEAELYRERWYWTDRKVAQVARHMRLAYQPLTRRWRLNVSPVPITNAGFGVTLNQNFDTLQDALDAIRRVGRLRLCDASEIGDEASHPVTFRFRLDTSQLPRPFQIGAVGQWDWNISAERSARLPLEKGR